MRSLIYRSLLLCIMTTASNAWSQVLIPRGACNDGYLFDIEQLKTSGNGKLVDDFYYADRKKIKEVWHGASKKRTSDMDAALIWALLADNGAFPDIEKLHSASYDVYRSGWRDRNDMPHIHAARLYLSSFGYRTGVRDAPNAYRRVYFLSMVDNDQVKAFINEYLKEIERYLKPELMKKWTNSFSEEERYTRIHHSVEYEKTQGMFIAFCNGLIDYSDYEDAVEALIEKSEKERSVME